MDMAQAKQELAVIVQNFAVIAHNLITVTAKQGTSADAFSQKNKRIIHTITTTHENIIKEVRTLLYSQNEAEQRKAFTTFGNYLLSLCNDFGIKKYYMISFPSTINPDSSPDTQIDQIRTAATYIETVLKAITPKMPLHTKLAKIFFYNFFSTKVLPGITSYGIAPTGAYSWGLFNAIKFSKQIEAHPHTNSFYNYHQVPHNQEVTYTDRPNILAQIVLGARIAEIKSKPCQATNSNNICNASNSVINMCKASKCNNCYQVRGFAPSSKFIRSVLWSLRPIIPLVAIYHFGQWIKEAQLPEYENRIRQKERKREEEAITNQMRHLKINYEKSIGLVQIKGQQELIEHEIKMIIDYLQHPLRYQNSASGTRSILLYGPPGTGKTILARAIAKESGAPLFELTADDILHNDAKQKILATFRLAEQVAAQRPEKSAIIYLDEIDAITGDRQNGTLDSQRAKALNNLLTIFDGIEKRNPFIHIVIIMATNHYKKLDAALLRPGRIDRKIAIMPPNAHGRQEFFDELLPDEYKHLMPWFVEQTDGYSGAQIVHIVDMAQMMASYAGHTKPTEQDYKTAVQKYKTEYEATLKLAQE